MMLGDRKATLLNYIAFHVNQNREHKRNKFLKDGRYWWFHSLPQFYASFPFWSERTIQKMLGELKEEGFLLCESVSRRSALWYSVEGKAIDKMDEAGVEALIARQTKVWDDASVANPASLDARVAVSASLEPLRVAIPATLRVADSADLKKRTKEREITREERDPAPPAGSRGKFPADDSDPQEVLLKDPPRTAPLPPGRRAADIDVSKTNEAALRRSLTKARSSTGISGLEGVWKGYVSMYHDVVTNVGAKEKAMLKTLRISCDKNSPKIDVPDFLEYTVANWSTLRQKMHWAKDLPEYPTVAKICTLFGVGLREHYLKQKMNGGTHGKKVTVFTSVEQIPANHPQYEILKHIVETTGRATTT